MPINLLVIYALEKLVFFIIIVYCNIAAQTLDFFSRHTW